MLRMLHRISGLVVPQLCKTAILYAYKAHSHKTLCYRAFLRKTCITPNPSLICMYVYLYVCMYVCMMTEIL